MADHFPIDALARELIARITTNHSRLLIGIAGVPGAGKSTFASALVEKINEVHPDIARLIPMDGFHFTNEQLDEQGLRSFKGAPQTFDAQAYIALLRRVCSDRDSSFSFPIYDRTLHEPVMNDDPMHCVRPGTRIVITEGNYLLLTAPPWDELGDLLDECWFLETPVNQAQSWLIDRHMRGGKSREQAAAHYERCDGPNTTRVLSERRLPDRIILPLHH
jgi:pantothenate kinase